MAGAKKCFEATVSARTIPTKDGFSQQAQICRKNEVETWWRFRIISNPLVTVDGQGVVFCLYHGSMKKGRAHRLVPSFLAPLARLERTTFRLGGGPSILVRYRGMKFVSAIVYPKSGFLSTCGSQKTALRPPFPLEKEPKWRYFPKKSCVYDLCAL